MFASYASRWGHALIDRRLYLPKVWANNPDRRARAHVPEDVAFATKRAMACEMIAKLLDEETPCAFVLADAVYGSDFWTVEECFLRAKDDLWGLITARRAHGTDGIGT